MNDFTTYRQRYRDGEWRAPIFRDMVLEEARRRGPGAVVLDIGCGNGFDGELDLQRDIAEEAGQYLGIEPDAAIKLGPYFTQTHRCCFEDAPLPPGSVDVAFAVMVLEHLREPARFWSKLGEVLADDGVFWAFTVDARHWFCRASLWLKHLRIKEYYLDALLGERGVERYNNYPVYYRANMPRQVLPHVRGFSSCEFVNFSRVGQLDYYLPQWLKPLGNLMDRRVVARNQPGAILAIRVTQGRREAGLACCAAAHSAR